MFTVIYKPTVKCNLSCSYCYVGIRHTEPHISVCNDEIETFKLLLENLVRIDDKNICIIFHGGEPLLMGKLFFERCANIVKQFESTFKVFIKKCIQTNLTNITVDFLECLQSNGYEISTSLDGTELAHNYFRFNRNGTKTFGKVIKNINIAKSMGFNVNAICCVSQLNVGKAKEVYDNFEKLQVNPKFNYLESETMGLPQKAMINPEQYADFIIQITDLWLNNKDSTIDVMPSSDMLSTIVNGYSESCIHATNCQINFVCVGPDGNVWPCGKCIGLKPFHLGNISNYENGVVSLKMRRAAFGKGLGLPIECPECEYSILCNGLCPFDNYAEHGRFNKISRWCKAYKILWGSMKKFANHYNLSTFSS